MASSLSGHDKPRHTGFGCFRYKWRVPDLGVSLEPRVAGSLVGGGTLASAFETAAGCSRCSREASGSSCLFRGRSGRLEPGYRHPIG